MKIQFHFLFRDCHRGRFILCVTRTWHFGRNQLRLLPSNLLNQTLTSFATCQCLSSPHSTQFAPVIIFTTIREFQHRLCNRQYHFKSLAMSPIVMRKPAICWHLRTSYIIFSFDDFLVEKLKLLIKKQLIIKTTKQQSE
jgi:hypothetical protein